MCVCVACILVVAAGASQSSGASTSTGRRAGSPRRPQSSARPAPAASGASSGALPTYTTSTTFPWRKHLPPYAYGTFNRYGRTLLEYALAAAGSTHANVQRRLEAYDDPASAGPAARVWADCARALAYSPFLTILDSVAVWDCIRLAVEKAKGTEPGLILPSYVEERMQCVCAAGCGKVVGDGGVKKMAYTAWGGALHYCSKDCWEEVRYSVRTQPRIHMQTSTRCMVVHAGLVDVWSMPMHLESADVCGAHRRPMA